MTASTDFWSARSLAGPFKTLMESSGSLAERGRMYPGLEWFMPTDMPGKAIIDFGAGPGHDSVLFLEHGAKHVYAVDISEIALGILRERCELHGIAESRYHTMRPPTRLPLADHLHCAGVLHHLDDPLATLELFHTAEPSSVRCMVYDGESEYVRAHGGPSSFATVNTGDNGAPIAHAWTQTQFQDLCAQAGWDAEYLGGYRYRGETLEGPPLSGCWSLTSKET